MLQIFFWALSMKILDYWVNSVLYTIKLSAVLFSCSVLNFALKMNWRIRALVKMFWFFPKLKKKLQFFATFHWDVAETLKFVGTCMPSNVHTYRNIFTVQRISSTYIARSPSTTVLFINALVSSIHHSS